MITHYKSWLEREGTTQKVQRLEFLGFVKEDIKDTPRVFFDKKRNAYLCGLYRCLLSDGSTAHLKFRCEYEPAEAEGAVGWNYNSAQEVVQDTVPEEITCTREMCEAGRVGTNYESTDLLEKSKQRYNTIMKIENIFHNPEYRELHNLAKLKLNYMISPSRDSSRNLQDYRQRYPELDEMLTKMVYDG